MLEMLPLIFHSFVQLSIPTIMLFISLSTIFVIFLQCCCCKKKNKLLQDNSRGVARAHDPEYATLHKLRKEALFPVRKTDKTDDEEKLKQQETRRPVPSKNQQKQRQRDDGKMQGLPKKTDPNREDDYALLEVDRLYIADNDGAVNPMPDRELGKNKIADEHSAPGGIQRDFRGGHKFSKDGGTYQTLEEDKLFKKKQR